MARRLSTSEKSILSSVTRSRSSSSPDDGKPSTEGRVQSHKVTLKGIKFDSKGEANRYLELLAMEQAGAIRDLRVHTTTKLMCGDRPILIRSARYKAGRHAQYTDDFRYEERTPAGWVLVVEDFKGWDMPEARFRRAVFEAMTGLQVRISTASAARRSPKRTSSATRSKPRGSRAR